VIEFLLGPARDDLPALLIAVPLLAATLCLIVRHARWTWALAVVVTWGTFLDAVLLLNRVLSSGTISYAEGGHLPPWGIELRVDLLNALVLVIVTGICAIVVTASPRSLDQEVWREHHHKFYALYLLCMTGLAGMTITGDAFNIFVFLEISSLSSYALISQGTTRRALTSAFQYLVMGTIGGTFILLGIGLIYMTTGTLNIADMAVQLAAVKGITKL
jgi:multicomponent Na+:H+ antiporter subunit D